nr:hypothetical protein [Tanacetum cinerariifolium]
MHSGASLTGGENVNNTMDMQSTGNLLVIDDDKLYTFKEGDYNRLRLQDIKDMLLLLIQGKLTNLNIEERLALGVSLDGTLNDVRSALDDTLKRIQMKYLPQKIWREVDRERTGAMIQAINRKLRNRRIIRSLEKFVEHQSDTQVIAMKIEILLKPTSNKLMVERFYTSAGNPIKEILLKLNLPDHRILKDEGEDMKSKGKEKVIIDEGVDNKEVWDNVKITSKICDKVEVVIIFDDDTKDDAFSVSDSEDDDTEADDIEADDDYEQGKARSRKNKVEERRLLMRSRDLQASLRDLEVSQIPNLDPPSVLFLNYIRTSTECDFVSLDSRIPSKKYTLDKSFTIGSTGHVLMLRSCSLAMVCLCVWFGGPGFDYVYKPSTNLFKMISQQDISHDQPPFYIRAGLRMAFDPTKSLTTKCDRFPFFSFDHFYRGIYLNDAFQWLDHFYRGIYSNDAFQWLETVNMHLTLYKLNIVDNDHLILTTIQILQVFHREGNLFESRGCLLPMLITIRIPQALCWERKLFKTRGCLLLVRRDYIDSQKFTVYEMKK